MEDVFGGVNLQAGIFFHIFRFTSSILPKITILHKI